MQNWLSLDCHSALVACLVTAGDLWLGWHETVHTALMCATGKTTAIVEIILQEVKRGNKVKPCLSLPYPWSSNRAKFTMHALSLYKQL